jgi:putative oxidoreductase
VSRRLLLIGGLFSAAIAALHIAVVFVGAPAYRYFGAGEGMARLVESGSLIPPVVTLAIALVFAVWALYGLSGAGLIRRLPLLEAGLLTIGVIYFLRGLLVIPEAMVLLQSGRFVLHRVVVFSLVSLACGILYLAGAIAHRRRT